jgi:hypothetical protein
MSRSVGYQTSFSGYRVVDMMFGNNRSEDNLMTVDDNALGDHNPPADDERVV